MVITGPLIARIKENPAAQQNPVGVGDERARPAHIVVALQRPFGALLAIVDKSPDGSLPMPVVGGVDGVFGAFPVDDRSGYRLVEPAGATVQGEDLGLTASQGEYDRRLRPINDKTGGDLQPPRLQEMGFGAVRLGEHGKNRKDRSNRDIASYYEGAVERIHRNRARARGIENQWLAHFLGDNRRHRSLPERADEHIVGENVQFLLNIAVRVRAGVARAKLAG